jgi:hypothetical protein
MSRMGDFLNGLNNWHGNDDHEYTHPDDPACDDLPRGCQMQPETGTYCVAGWLAESEYVLTPHVPVGTPALCFQHQLMLIDSVRRELQAIYKTPKVGDAVLHVLVDTRAAAWLHYAHLYAAGLAFPPPPARSYPPNVPPAPDNRRAHSSDEA